MKGRIHCLLVKDSKCYSSTQISGLTKETTAAVDCISYKNTRVNTRKSDKKEIQKEKLIKLQHLEVKSLYIIMIG